jgi:hypothetical protein
MPLVFQRSKKSSYMRKLGHNASHEELDWQYTLKELELLSHNLYLMNMLYENSVDNNLVVNQLLIAYSSPPTSTAPN